MNKTDTRHTQTTPSAPKTIRILGYGDGWCKIGPDDGHGHICKVVTRFTKTDNLAERADFERKLVTRYNNYEALVAFVKDSPCQCNKHRHPCERCALLSQLEAE